MVGIYKITKKENGKSYIGQSNDIERRFREHKYKRDIPIDIAIQKYGEDAFTFEILEECQLDKLDERDRITYQSFQRILCGMSYKDLPIYKKKEKIWINK